MTAAVESVEKPKECKAPVERSAVAAETDLSVNQPKKEEVCTATTLPTMTIMDNTNPARPALSDAAVATAATEARDAIHPGLIGFRKPEVLKKYH